MSIRIFPAILAIMLIAFFGTDYFLMRSSNIKFSATEIQFRKDLNEYLSTSLSSLVNKETERALCQSLYGAYHRELLAFFMLKSESRGVLCIKNRSGNEAELDVKYNILDKIVFNPTSSVSYRATKNGDYLLVTGTPNDSDTQLARMQDERNKFAWFYLFKGIIVFASVLYLGFGWISEFLQKIRDKGFIPSKLESFASRLIRFKEVEQLAQVSESTYNELTRTQRELALVSSSLTSGLLKEIKSKHKSLPYTFEAAILRMDLNNYTKRFLTTDQAEMIELIQKYAALSDEGIFRHNGLIYQFIGDEFVAVFPKGESGSPAATAVACAHDILETLNQDLGGGEKLTVKISVAKSDLTFYKLPFGFYFTGLALIESQRLLNEAREKTVNTLLLSEVVHSEVSQMIKLYSSEAVLYKGFEEQSTIYRVESFHESTSNKGFEASIFRSNEYIRHLLNTLKENPFDSSSYVEALRKYKTSRVPEDVIIRWIDTLLSLASHRGSEETSRILASFIMTAESLVPQHQWSTALSDSILSLPAGFDGRVYANAIEILLQKSFETISLDKLTPLLNAIPEGYYRAHGNILLALSQSSLTVENLKQIARALNSSDDKELQTAIWVAQEAYVFHANQNRARFQSFDEFSEIKNTLESLRLNPNENIASRARRSLEKINRLS